MKYLLGILLIIWSFPGLNAQVHSIPDWVINIPPSNDTVIYSIGISDPKGRDLELAKKVAINRALSIAVLLEEMTIQFVSDFFESERERYRWFVRQDYIQEMGRYNSSAYIDDNSFEVVKRKTNTNDEVIVLLRYYPNNGKDHNFFVSGEYFRQDYEASNTRSLKTLQSFELQSSWIIDKNTALKSDYCFQNANGNIVQNIMYDTIVINPPNLSYRYSNLPQEGFNLHNFYYGSRLNRGLWASYVLSFAQSINRISRNYSSSLGTVQDDYDLGDMDDYDGIVRHSLSRQSNINTLSFCINYLNINNNHLYVNISLDHNRRFYAFVSRPSLAVEENTTDTGEKSRMRRFLDFFKFRSRR